MKEIEIIPGLGEKLKRWRRDNVSKVKDIIAYMQSFPEPMTEIGLAEAAQIGQTTEKGIAGHLSGNKRFEITAKAGVYRLLDASDKSVVERAALKHSHEAKGELDGMGAPEKSDEQKEFEQSTLPNDGFVETPAPEKPDEKCKACKLNKTAKKDPLAVISRTAYFCPHCDREITIKGCD